MKLLYFWSNKCNLGERKILVLKTSKKPYQLQTFDQICICVMQYSWRKLTLLIVSAGLVQVQQKVVGIIPSSTAGTAQSFPAFQPRTATINIRPNTTTSTQQAWALSKMIHSGKLRFFLFLQ